MNKDPRLPKLPVPTPKPDIAIFNRLLLSPIGRPVVTGPGPIEPLRPQAAGLPHGFARAIASDVDPAKLGGLRETLLKQIPSAPELEKLRIWPWYEWAPWWDCEPDIIFRVTQNCAGVEQVIVQESFLNARFDVPTSLDVTLVANSSACCAVGQKPPPPGNCVLLSSVCSDENLADQITNIGGNIGAPATPVGYQNPGLVAPTGDRPYAGTLSIFGQFGAGAAADYYEFEYSDNNGASWTSLPPGSVAAPPRLYFGPPLFGEPAFPPIRAVPSTITTIGARTFIESRAHFEANHGAGTWGSTHLWTTDWLEMVLWVTSSTTFADGTYRLRVRNWTAAELAAGAHIATNTPLDICDPDPANPDKQNHVYITLDNRLDPDPSHPTGDHPCGAGTVHICTTEPDSRFIDVRLVQSGQPDTELAACADRNMRVGDNLQIDFFVYDPDGHLAQFELYATYDNSISVPVLLDSAAQLVGGAPYVNASINIPSATSPGTPAAWNYGEALTMHVATSPIWPGGTFRLTVPAANIFKETCCYQLVLYSHKRTLTCGDESLWVQYNLSEFNFMIIVP